jgi:hypothetical protein
MVRTVPREKGGDAWDFTQLPAAALEVFGCRRTAQEVTRSVYFHVSAWGNKQPTAPFVISLQDELETFLLRRSLRDTLNVINVFSNHIQ